MTKTTQEVMTKAVQMRPDVVEFFQKHLGSFGDMVDQLRVLGHVCQAMVDLAQHELEELRMQDELEKPKILLAN
jgi:hypothetical protein